MTERAYIKSEPGQFCAVEIVHTHMDKLAMRRPVPLWELARIVGVDDGKPIQFIPVGSTAQNGPIWEIGKFPCNRVVALNNDRSQSAAAALFEKSPGARYVTANYLLQALVEAVVALALMPPLPDTSSSVEKTNDPA